MSDFDSDGGSDNQWDERGDLAWNEFDWERYLREQDEAIHRYLRFYEAASGPDRIDEVAEKMNWGDDDDDLVDSDNDSGDEAATGADSDEADVYTLHKNPLMRSWPVQIGRVQSERICSSSFSAFIAS